MKNEICSRPPDNSWGLITRIVSVFVPIEFFNPLTTIMGHTSLISKPQQHLEDYSRQEANKDQFLTSNFNNYNARICSASRRVCDITIDND